MSLIVTHKNAAALVEYHRCDFDAKTGGPPAPVFVGTGAERLGITDGVRKAFSRLSRGHHPANGARLSPRQSDKRRVSYELVLAAPKSPSIIGLAFDAPPIIEAHQQAVMAMLYEAETLAMTRVRREGADMDRRTGNLVACVITHFTSRYNDPHLHSHVHIFNLTWDDEEQRWKALQALELFQNARLLLAVYHAHFRAALHSAWIPHEASRQCIRNSRCLPRYSAPVLEAAKGHRGR